VRFEEIPRSESPSAADGNQPGTAPPFRPVRQCDAVSPARHPPPYAAPEALQYLEASRDQSRQATRNQGRSERDHYGIPRDWRGGGAGIPTGASLPERHAASQPPSGSQPRAVIGSCVTDAQTAAVGGCGAAVSAFHLARRSAASQISSAVSPRRNSSECGRAGAAQVVPADVKHVGVQRF
jgi:hypothetical protein